MRKENKMNLEGHAKDCTIRSPISNGNYEDGLCTCGYGLQEKRKGDCSKMYSKELLKELGELKVDSISERRELTDKLFRYSK